MNQKPMKRKGTRCLVPSCERNKPNAPPLPTVFPGEPPLWHEITGETKLFYNPIIPKTYLKANEQQKLMVCTNHFTYQETIKDLENRLEKAPIGSELTELVEQAIQESLKNYELLPVLSSIFEPLVDRLNKLSKRAADKLPQDEPEFLIKLLDFTKLIMRSLDNRQRLLEIDLAETLVSLIEVNELKSSQDDENRVRVVALSMLLFTNFCMVDEDKVDKLLERVYKSSWNYLSMDVAELQHQTFAFLWALLNNRSSRYKQRLRKELMFLFKRFNEYRDQWPSSTLEIAIAFLASVVFNEGKDLLKEINEEEIGEIRSFIDYVEDFKMSLSDKGRYFSERIVGYLQPILIEKKINQSIAENADVAAN